MTYAQFLAQDPLFWAALAGIAVGAALASATRLVARRGDVHRARSRKWTAATLWMTAAVVFASCGVFVPPGTVFFRLDTAYVAAGTTVFFALALRFPRAAGIPAFLIVAAVSVAAPLIMRPFVPVRDETVIASLRVLSGDNDVVYGELISGPTVGMDDAGMTETSAGREQVLSFPNSSVRVRADLIRFSPYLFFLGGVGGARFGGFFAGPSDTDQAVAQPYSDVPFVGWMVRAIPLIQLSTVSSDPVRLRFLRVYDAVVTPELALSIQQTTDTE